MQAYLKIAREGGDVVSAGIAMAAARGILLTCNRLMLAEFGRPVTLNQPRAYSLLQRMKFVQGSSLRQEINTTLKILPSWSSNFWKMWLPVYGRNSTRTDPQLGSNRHQNCPQQQLDHGQASCQTSRDWWSQQQTSNYGSIL